MEPGAFWGADLKYDIHFKIFWNFEGAHVDRSFSFLSIFVYFAFFPPFTHTSAFMQCSYVTYIHRCWFDTKNQFFCDQTMQVSSHLCNIVRPAGATHIDVDETVWGLNVQGTFCNLLDNI